MTYYLANTGRTPVKWYKFNPLDIKEPYELVDKLDLKTLPSFGNKKQAKQAALSLGLQTWRYVRI
jgi:hypothetical protein